MQQRRVHLFSMKFSMQIFASPPPPLSSLQPTLSQVNLSLCILPISSEMQSSPTTAAGTSPVRPQLLRRRQRRVTVAKRAITNRRGSEREIPSLQRLTRRPMTRIPSRANAAVDLSRNRNVHYGVTNPSACAEGEKGCILSSSHGVEIGRHSAVRIGVPEHEPSNIK